MRFAPLTLAMALTMTGCAVTAPVRGRVQGTPEDFVGKATGGLSGSGKIEVKTSAGATCSGTWAFYAGRQGSGVFNCDDGRTGPFQFVSTGRQGSGTGDLGGRRFTFTIGD